MTTMTKTLPSRACTAGAATAGVWIVAHYGGRALRRLAVTGTLLALLLAFARVYVGARYPGDVLAGLGIGAGITILGWLVLNRALTFLARRAAIYRTLRPFLIAASGRAAHLRRPDLTGGPSNGRQVSAGHREAIDSASVVETHE